jgi:hypothetical protein
VLPPPCTNCPSKWPGSTGQALQSQAVICNFLNKFTHEKRKWLWFMLSLNPENPANPTLPGLLGSSYWRRSLNWKVSEEQRPQSLPARLWTNNGAGWMKADKCKSWNPEAGSHRGCLGPWLAVFLIYWLLVTPVSAFSTSHRFVTVWGPTVCKLSSLCLSCALIHRRLATRARQPPNWSD